MSKDSIMSYGLVVEQQHVKQGLTDRLRTVENCRDHSWLISTVGTPRSPPHSLTPTSNAAIRPTRLALIPGTGHLWFVLQAYHHATLSTCVLQMPGAQGSSVGA